ncbi:hypothetical protein MP638_000626 [Amoeboaphelidium occidentale]|nr:hypothetical protein MP638_000626 [Amoeboaphelidium occidentale]
MAVVLESFRHMLALVLGFCLCFLVSSESSAFWRFLSADGPRMERDFQSVMSMLPAANRTNSTAPLCIVNTTYFNILLDSDYEVYQGVAARVFNVIDVDQNGRITEGEYILYLNMRANITFASVPATVSNALLSTFSQADSDGTGQVTYPEFYQMLLQSLMQPVPVPGDITQLCFYIGSVVEGCFENYGITDQESKDLLRKQQNLCLNGFTLYALRLQPEVCVIKSVNPRAKNCVLATQSCLESVKKVDRAGLITTGF